MNQRILVFGLVAGTFSQESPLPNPRILKWQAEAQARERAINRRAEHQLKKPPPARPPENKKKPTLALQPPKGQ